MAGHDAARTGRGPAGLRPPFVEVWKVYAGVLLGGIVVSDGVVVVGGFHGQAYHVCGLDARTGRELWSQVVHGIVYGTPAVHDGRVYLGKADAATCLNLKNGEIVWHRAADGLAPDPEREAFHSHNAPLCLDGIVFFLDHVVRAFDVKDGRVLLEGPTRSKPRMHTGPCADEEYVYLPMSSFEILRFERKSRTLAGAIRAEGKVCSGPVVAGTRLLYGTSRNTLVAVDRAKGATAWSHTFEHGERFVESRPAAGEGRVYLGGPDGKFYSLDLETGALRWSLADLGPVDGAPIVSGETLLVLSRIGFHALDGLTGKVCWSRERYTRTEYGCAPAISGGVVFVGMESLSAFAPA